MSDISAAIFILALVGTISISTQFASPNTVKQIVFTLFMLNLLAITSMIFYLIKK